MALSPEEINRIVDKIQGEDLSPNGSMLYALINFLMKTHEEKTRERDYGTVEIKITYKNGVIDTASKIDQTSLKNNVKG